MPTLGLREQRADLLAQKCFQLFQSQCFGRICCRIRILPIVAGAGTGMVADADIIQEAKSCESCWNTERGSSLVKNYCYGPDRARGYKQRNVTHARATPFKNPPVRSHLSTG